MKGEKIIDALGKIDDRLVMAAIPAPREHKRSVWPMVLAAAAVAALCIFAVPKVLLQFDPGDPVEPQPPVSTDDGQEPEHVINFVTVPETAEAFPATVKEAEQWGMDLKTLEEWGILDILQPIYGEKSSGSFPIWSADVAMERLQEGYGYCAMETPDPQPLIYQLGLVEYRPDGIEHTVPYYWFSVELKNGEQGLYFLPAIHDKYLSCVARWKEPGCDTIAERLRLTPDDYGISQEVRDAFAAFITKEGLEDKYRDPDYYLQLYKTQIDGKGEVAVLYCSGPLLVNMGDSQCFHYVYKQGEVVWGPSGNWYSAQTDLAQTIRRMLLYRDAEDAGSQEEYDKLVREAFAQYFIENKNVLMYLPSFDAETPPDRDALLLYTILRGGLDTSSFTAEELDAAIAGLMEGVTFEHGPANQLQLENGVYTYLPYGLEGDMTYYRPENCVWNSGSNTYTLILHGYTFSEEDFRADSTESSENWNALWTYLEQNTDMGIELSRQYLIQHFDGLLLSLLYADIPEDFGMKASETLTVTFRLQAGDHPLRFVSCKREMLQ